MGKKIVLYIQFYTGELARLEQRAVLHSAGDLAKFIFKDSTEIDVEKLDLIHDYDQIILGTAPYDYPENLTENIMGLVNKVREMNYPCLGIDFGHLILAGSFGYQIERSAELAEINQIVELTVRHPQADISPTFGIDLAETDKQNPKFYAYVNHADTVVNGDNTTAIISSDRSNFMAIEYTRHIFSVQFLPFLDHTAYLRWVRAYPDFWKNLKGFWGFNWARNNRILNKLVMYITYKWLMTEEERKSDIAYQQEIEKSWHDLSKSVIVLRNFVTKISKTR